MEDKEQPNLLVDMNSNMKQEDFSEHSVYLGVSVSLDIDGR